MSLDLETLKSVLGCLQNGKSLKYIDEEGTKIPIDSDIEFQEALRLAKLNKTQLKLLVYDDNVGCNRPVFLNLSTPTSTLNPSEKSSDCLKNKKMNSMPLNSILKEISCLCKEDVPPEWFTHYMKKFKKDILHELKSSIADTVEKAVEKEKKSSKTKSDIVDLFLDKNEVLVSSSGSNSKKKKVPQKDLSDFLDEREGKLSKKSEKLHPTKIERLEKLSNKAKLLLDEKRKLLEKKRHSKFKSDEKSITAPDKNCSLKKSGFFRENSLCLHLTPGSDFSVNVTVMNDGELRWSAPRLECFDFVGLYPIEARIDLPRLQPRETCLTAIRGRAADTVGLYHFKWRLMDGLEKFTCPEFTCWGKVHFELYPNCCNDLFKSEKSNGCTVQSQESVGTLIGLEKELIADSQKKIEENIMEIEKRLRDIDLLRPSTSSEANFNKNASSFGKTKKPTQKKSEDFQTVACDFLLDLEEKGKYRKKFLKEEEVLFGVDCLRLASDNIRPKINAQKDDNGNTQNVGKAKTDTDGSDSDLSVIFMPEDNENFVMIPLLFESPSPAESVHEDQGFAHSDSTDRQTSTKVQPTKPEAKLKRKNKNVKELSHPNEESPTRNRRSPFGEEIPISKAKKMKSKSTEYHFTTANLTQPTFSTSTIAENNVEGRPSKFTFLGKKEEKTQQESVFEERPSRFTFTGEGEQFKSANYFKEKNIPKTDTLGRVIFAVTSNGYCLPVEDLFCTGEQPNRKRENSEREKKKKQNQYDKRSDRFSETTEGKNTQTTFQPFSSVLVNGASNVVASMAFNTAKCLFDNLPSIFAS